MTCLVSVWAARPSEPPRREAEPRAVWPQAALRREVWGSQLWEEEGLLPVGMRLRKQVEGVALGEGRRPETDRHRPQPASQPAFLPPEVEEPEQLQRPVLRHWHPVLRALRRLNALLG
ncbi:MAG: hypothetical protein K8R36_24625, partial [Planctomycetales bacterium]|nr:hypothetical protein [Planctomycetales bacterium]